MGNTIATQTNDIATVAQISSDVTTVASNIATISQKATVDEATALAIALERLTMANTFKVITRDVAQKAGTPETIYTVQTGSTLVVQSIFLTNVHTAQVDVTLQLVSTTTQTSQTQNTTERLSKDVPLPKLKAH